MFPSAFGAAHWIPELQLHLDFRIQLSVFGTMVGKVHFKAFEEDIP